MTNEWMLVVCSCLPRCCAAAGSASVSFRISLSYRVGTNPTAVAVGDFDRDGKPDFGIVNAGHAT